MEGVPIESAHFRYEGADFVLVPGSRERWIGYDRARSPEFEASVRADWEQGYGEHGVSLEAYLDHYSTKRRQCSIEPMLVEVSAQTVEVGRDGVELDAVCSELCAQLSTGFRLPNTDEWEYLCGGGSQAWFRWGSELPDQDSYNVRDWELHQRPNAFGLHMNHSTYESELCADAELRGGDGGSAICGGYGHLATWAAASDRISNAKGGNLRMVHGPPFAAAGSLGHRRRFCLGLNVP